jgi:glycosyltransferase involved in cell wall biosynthesis
MKKIFYVITKGNWGGAQKYVFDMATRLPRGEFQTKVVTGEGEILPQKLQAANIPVIRLPSLGRNIHIVKDAMVFADLIRLFRKEKPDVVHLNSSKIGGLGALAARVSRVKKIIFTVHGFAFNEQRPPWQKALIIFLSWLTIIFSTDVIFISNTERDRAKKWPFISKKAHLVYNGIEAPQFVSRDEARTILAKTLGKSPAIFENKKVLGTIAELTGNKGLHHAIEAIEHIPDSIYIIIGRGELEQTLKTTIKERYLENKVFLTGFMKDASSLLQGFDVFLLPSIKEGMPYVLFEAGFATLPVIATDVGGIREIITDQNSGLIIPSSDSKAIEGAIQKIFAQPQKTAMYGQNLHRHISSHFTISQSVDNTVAIYRDSTI